MATTDIYFKKLINFFLITLSLLASIKLCFFSLAIDEEYAITMAYRMATGDQMFLDMWEPHQTSGFLTALLIRIFHAITGTTEYLVLYLRICGTLIQASISIFLYRTLKKYFTPSASFICAIFFFNTLPKWIQTPEFANMLIWFSTLAFLCFLNYYQYLFHKETTKPQNIWLILAGISLAGMVLSYPSSLFAIPIFLIAMWKTDSKRFLHDILLLLGTCLILAFVYISYFLSHMSLSQFIFGFRQMMTDGSHNETILERFLVYGNELLTLIPHAALTLTAALLITLLYRKWYHSHSTNKTWAPWLIFTLSAILFAQIQQLIIWLMDGLYLHYPLVHNYILFALGFLAYSHRPSESDKKHRLFYWFGLISGCAVWLCALLITNTTISVTGTYLMIALLTSILFISEHCTITNNKPFYSIPNIISYTMTLALLGTTLFSKGFLICESEGMKYNVTYVRQKALYGPAKGVYCRYTDGYAYNAYSLLAEEYINDGDSVLYVGEHTLRYLLGNQTISNYSTISTPTYDERLFTYWEFYPDRYPDVIIIDSGDTYEKEIKSLFDLDKPVADHEGIQIYYIK